MREFGILICLCAGCITFVFSFLLATSYLNEVSHHIRGPFTLVVLAGGLITFLAYKLGPSYAKETNGCLVNRHEVDSLHFHRLERAPPKA